jgi:hypothetical protein
MRHWTYALVGLVFASGVVLTACGGSDEDSTATGGTGGGATGGTGGSTGGTGGSTGGTGGNTGGTGGDTGGTGGNTGGTGGNTGGTGGNTGGTGGSACTAPAAPATPTPANAANDIDPTTTSLDWDDAADAVSYDVFFGDTCPPPAYPDAAYENMTASELTGLTLSGSTDYCWKVVALGDGTDCFTEGPDWSFSTACSPPGTPAGPTPADGATDVDAASTTALDWDDSDGSATYDVYFGDTCPPPAYPDAAYENVSASELTGLTLSDGTNYCWKVVAVDATGNCTEEGPNWTFDTTCVDPVAGAPTVTSTDFQATGTSGTYTLTFSEDVTNVDASLTWAATTGTGSLGTVTALDAQTYEVAFTGVAPGDVYTLTVGTTVLDTCGTPLDAAVNITITVSAGGSLCATALELDPATLPTQLTGEFPDDPAFTTSCDDSPTNVVWYTFRAQSTGTHHIEAANDTATDAWSRLAIFEGTTCLPSGTEVDCDTAEASAIDSYVELTQGTDYTILFFTDGNSYTMVDPEINITPITWMDGQDCSQPLDVSGASFPYTATGNFPYASSDGASCDTTPNNMAWFTYTPSVSGWHDITGSLATASIPVRLAVFESAACNPAGTELDCVADSSLATTMVNLTQGTEYLILFHTSDATDEMTDPTIDIAPTTFADGELCEQPLALASASLPYTATGTFDYGFAAGGSCDATAFNTVWYTYSPAVTGWYEFAAQTTNASADVRLAVFDSAACDPHGAEVACVTSNTDAVTTTVELTQGSTYLIGFYTNYDSEDMTDPTIDVSAVTIDPGEMCAGPLDLTSETFPYTATGDFTQDPTDAGTCDSTPFNAAWFTYTPSTTGYYELLAQNGNATSATRLAVFDSTACSPLGAQLACEISTTDTSAETVYLTQNTTYLIAFFANSDSEQMLDPVIDISPATFNAGESCASPVDVTSETFPYTVTGTFDYELGSAGACDSTPNNMVWFSYTPATTESVEITLTNATTTNAYSRVVVFEGSDCASLGTELACVTGSGKTATASVGLTQGTQYLIGFYTDGESYTMVDPTISITPTPPGFACGTPEDLTGATFPYQLTGDYTDDSGSGGTCDSTPNNIVWFTYTPSTTGSYTINADNATSTYAYSRLAVFEGVTCSPTGTQLACETASGTSISATLDLTQGTEYLFMFYTDGASYSMIDPTIEIIAN